MKDTDLMPFGKYKGMKLANVPAHYLIWIYENCELSFKLEKYIVDNMDVLKKESANHNKFHSK